MFKISGYDTKKTGKRAAEANEAYLLGNHGEYGQLDAVELVEAAPQARLAQSLENLGHVGVPLLVGAVCHNLQVRGTRRKAQSIDTVSEKGRPRGSQTRGRQGFARSLLACRKLGREKPESCAI